MRKRIITALILISIIACCFLSYNYGYIVGRKKAIEILKIEEVYVKLDAYLKECIELWFPEHGTE